jgi:hypothetical protein
VHVRRAANGYVVSIGAPLGQYNPGTRQFSFLIKSVPPGRVVNATDDGQARQVEIK